jgi:uncharacterized protein (TIGR03118 family)
MKSRLMLAFGFCLLASAALAQGFKVTPLVSDVSGKAKNTDAQLVNAWGLAQVSDSDPVWVSDNNSNVSTFYDRTTGAKVGVVTISSGNPTGIVANSAGGFDVSESGKSGSSVFIFDTESGTIEGWAPSVNSGETIVAYNGTSKGSVYKGLALDPTTNHLFAADFANNQVQIFDNTFTLLGSFTDTSLPKGYAPFGIAVLDGNVYVAFAKQDKTKMNQVNGAGLGYVDVFSTSGTLISQLIAQGPLDAPWGLTIAPSGFGSFAGDLLVGNFGNGWINAFDATTGASLGWLPMPNGNPLVINGLWGLDNGPGTKTITFSSGPDKQMHGLLGLITPMK